MEKQILKLEKGIGEYYQEARIMVKNGQISEPLKDFAKSHNVKIYDEKMNLLNP